MRSLLARGEPFYFPGGSAGCLLVHGFGGAPDEMRWMGEHLVERGLSVLGIRLFGHGTDPADMNRARWRDWLASVEDGYHLLSGQCNQVVAVGFSLGGALSLLAARHLPLAGVVTMATPLEVPDPRVRRLRWAIPLLSKFVPFLEHPPPSPTSVRGTPDEHLHYPVYPVRATAELHDVLREMRRRLYAVQLPALLIYARNDPATSADDAESVLSRLGSSDKQLLWIEEGGHVIPRGAGRQSAFAAVEEFARRVTS